MLGPLNVRLKGVQLEGWKSSYAYSPAEIVNQVKEHLVALEATILAEYLPNKDAHLKFMTATEFGRSKMDQHSGFAKGEYSDQHIAAVLIFLKSWAAKATGGDFEVVSLSFLGILY